MMRKLAAHPGSYLCRRKPVNVQSHFITRVAFRGSSNIEEAIFKNSPGIDFKDEKAMEDVAERKIGWLFKLIFGGTATLVGYTIFPYLDERRMKIIEMGGTKGLLNMLDSGKDNCTCNEALKAIAALAHSDEAVGALHRAGAISVIKSAGGSVGDAEIEQHELEVAEEISRSQL